MKKVFIALIFVLFITPLVSSINLGINSNYKPGETLLGTLEGNFISSPTPENFYFYSDREQMPLIFDITKIQDKYYFYALLPSEERNYTLDIKNLKFYENGKEMTGDIERNFSVSGNSIDFSVYPGFLIMRNVSSLTVESQNQPLSVSANFLNTTQTIQVSIAQKKKIYFSATGFNANLSQIEISALNTKYLIPVSILSITSPETENIETEKFRFSKSEHDFSVYEKNKTTFRIYLQNLGDAAIKNVSLSYSDTLKGTIELSPDTIEEIKESESKSIDLIVDAKTYKTFQGTITALAGNNSAETFITLNSIETGTPLPVENPDNNLPEGKSSCSDLGGILCTDTQVCSVESVDSLEGLCCVNGTCDEQKSYWGIIFGIILILAVAGGLYYLYKRSKKSKITSDDVLENQKKRFEERERNREISGSLARS